MVATTAATMMPLSTTVEKLSTSVEQLSTSVEQLSTTIEQLSTTVEQLSTTVEQFMGRTDDRFSSVDSRLSLLEARFLNFEAGQKNAYANRHFSRIHPILKISGTQIQSPPSCYPLTVEKFWELQDLENRNNLHTLTKFYEMLPEETILSIPDYIDRNVEEVHSMLAGALSLDYRAIREAFEVETKNREMSVLLDYMRRNNKRKAEELGASASKRKDLGKAKVKDDNSPRSPFPTASFNPDSVFLPPSKEGKSLRQWQKEIKALEYELSEYYESSRRSPSQIVTQNNTISPRASPDLTTALFDASDSDISS